jgi:hypothetical protein
LSEAACLRQSTTGESAGCRVKAGPWPVIRTAETARDFRQTACVIFRMVEAIALVLGDGDIDPRRPRRRSESCFGWQLLNFRYRWLGATRLYFFISLARHSPAIGVALAGLASHYRLSSAFCAGDASLVVPLDFMRVPLIAVVGWAFYCQRRTARHFRPARCLDHRLRRIVGSAHWGRAPTLSLTLA